MSCQNATINSSGIECTGAYSCYQAELLTVLDYYMYSGGDLYCSGSNSCESVGLIELFWGLYCGGINSCVDSQITRSGENTGIDANNKIEVICCGDHSCAYSEFNSAADMDIVGSGAYSLHRATINTDNSTLTSLNVTLTGYYAGIYYYLFIVFLFDLVCFYNGKFNCSCIDLIWCFKDCFYVV